MRNCAKTAPRWPAGPMRRSAAIVTSWPIWCGAFWKTAPIHPSWRLPPTMRCRGDAAATPGRYHRRRPPTRGIRTSAAARSLSAAAAEFARHRIRRARGVARAAAVRSRAKPRLLRRRRSSTVGRRRARRDRSSARSTERRSEASSMPMPAQANEAITAAREGFKIWSRNARRDARAYPRAAPPTLLEQRRCAFHRAVATRGRQDAR